MNGDVLKKVFLIIIVTLCLIITILTASVLLGKFPVDSYKEVLEILGAPALLSMVITSFIHSNIKEGDSNATTITNPTSGSVDSTITGAGTDKPSGDTTGRQP